MSLRTRIDRLACRSGGRSWIEPAGENEDGVPMEAHVYEHADGRRYVLIAPEPTDDSEEWTRECERIEAKRRSETV